VFVPDAQIRSTYVGWIGAPEKRAVHCLFLPIEGSLASTILIL
jgi:hypothetical protein